VSPVFGFALFDDGFNCREINAVETIAAVSEALASV
jgi:hypothetical protein